MKSFQGTALCVQCVNVFDGGKNGITRDFLILVCSEI